MMALTFPCLPVTLLRRFFIDVKKQGKRQSI